MRGEKRGEGCAEATELMEVLGKAELLDPGGVGCEFRMELSAW